MIVRNDIIISLVQIDCFVKMIDITEVTLYFCVKDMPYKGQKVRLEACEGTSLALLRMAITGEIKNVEILNKDKEDLWVEVSIVKNERLVYGKDWKEEA